MTLQCSDSFYNGQGKIRHGGTDPLHQHDELYNNTAFKNKHRGEMLAGMEGTGHKTERE